MLPSYSALVVSGTIVVKEKGGLASIPAFAAVELGQLLLQVNTEFKDHGELSPFALPYLWHAVTNSERSSLIASWHVAQIDTKYRHQRSTAVFKSCGLIIETV